MTIYPEIDVPPYPNPIESGADLKPGHRGIGDHNSVGLWVPAVREVARSAIGLNVVAAGRYSRCSARAARLRVAASPGSAAITAAAASQPAAITASAASGTATTGVMPS